MPAARPDKFLRSIAIQVTMAFCALNPSLADAQVSCADWNTAKFFGEAKAQDVTRCVAAGSDPNARDDSGFTPLHKAAANSTEPAVIARLLDAGADPEAGGDTGLTPLHVAVGGSASPAVVMALIDAGADLDARDNDGYTPLHAAGVRSAWPAVVTALVKAGADVKVRTESGKTPLHVAAGGSASPAMVTALIDAGADLDARDNAGYTPLHVAGVRSASPAVVTALVSAGANLEARTELGYTPLHVAAGGSKAPAVVTALVNAGASLEAKTGAGLTPLHVAAGVSELPAVVTALVNAGADPHALDHANNTAGNYAQHNDALKDTEAYGQLEDSITIIGPDTLETWMRLGSMNVWGLVVLYGLMLWGLYSGPVRPPLRDAGTVVIAMLSVLPTYVLPDWAVALSGKEPMEASLAEMAATAMETGMIAAWIAFWVVGAAYWLLFFKRLTGRAHIAAGSVAFLVAAIVSLHARDWVDLIGLA